MPITLLLYVTYCRSLHRQRLFYIPGVKCLKYKKWNAGEIRLLVYKFIDKAFSQSRGGIVLVSFNNGLLSLLC